MLEMIAAASAGPEGGGPEPTIADRRSAMNAMTKATFLSVSVEGPPMADEQTYLIDVDGGQIRVRVYRPSTDAILPGYLSIHGGGFWLGDIDLYDHSCRSTAVAADCVVAAVGYRLAPEFRYPTAAEDCYAALLRLAGQGEAIGIDPSRLAVGGGSAGGNLAAVVAQMARDRNGPTLRAQMLDIPVTDLTMSQPSIVSNGSGYMLTAESMAEYTGYYAPDVRTRTEAYASPLLAADMSNLPPACITTCEFDPLRDEGEAYAGRLVAAGVPVFIQRALGHIHGSHHMVKLAPDAAVYDRRANDFLRRYLHES